MNVSSYQDGAVYDNILFDFNGAGTCYVYDLVNKKHLQTFTVTNGKDGIDGVNGINGKTPLLRINETTNEWEVSYNDG